MKWSVLILHRLIKESGSYGGGVACDIMHTTLAFETEELADAFIETSKKSVALMSNHDILIETIDYVKTQCRQ